MILTILVMGIEQIIYGAVGASFIQAAIRDYGLKKYWFFGFEIMGAITSVAYIIKSIFRI